MQPVKYSPGKKVCGKFLSVLPRGIYSFWDGGSSMGLYVREVPWSNKKAKPDEVATGLWDENGDVIFASNSFLATMPPLFLSGYFCDDCFKVLSSPPCMTLFDDFKDSNQYHHIEFTLSESLKFLDSRPEVLTNIGAPTVTEDLLDLDDMIGIYQSSVEVLASYKLSPLERKAKTQLATFIKALEKRQDADGFILRHPESEWRRGQSCNFIVGDKGVNLE
jgi:hypothetical protein